MLFSWGSRRCSRFIVFKYFPDLFFALERLYVIFLLRIHILAHIWYRDEMRGRPRFPPFLATTDTLNFHIHPHLSIILHVIKNTQTGLLLTSIIALIIIFFFDNAIDIWYVFGSIAASSILIPFLLLVYDFKKTKYPMVCLILPIISCIIWVLIGYPYNLDSIYPGLLVSLIINYLALRE